MVNVGGCAAGDIQFLRPDLGRRFQHFSSTDEMRPPRLVAMIGRRIVKDQEHGPAIVVFSGGDGAATAKAPMRRTIKCWNLFKQAYMTLILETPKSSRGKFW